MKNHHDHNFHHDHHDHHYHYDYHDHNDHNDHRWKNVLGCNFVWGKKDFWTIKMNGEKKIIKCFLDK